MKTFQQYISETIQHVKQTEIMALSRLLSMQCLIIDIREPSEWEQGIIPGAVCCPRGILESKIETLVKAQGDKDQPLSVYLYCRSGARSVLAAQSLQNMGMIDCYSVKGGFEAWNKARLPVAGVSKKVIC